MIFQTRAGDYRKMGTEQCADGVTFTFQCPKELACAVVLFEKKTWKAGSKDRCTTTVSCGFGAFCHHLSLKSRKILLLL